MPTSNTVETDAKEIADHSHKSIYVNKIGAKFYCNDDYHNNFLSGFSQVISVKTEEHKEIERKC